MPLFVGRGDRQLPGGALPTSLPATVLPLVEPILVERHTAPFDHPDWVFEPKYDGFRGVLYLGPRLALFGSKRRNVLTRFEGLAQQLRRELRVRDAILDGEVVALDDEGRADFYGLLRGEGRLHYVAFDLLWLNGRDLRAQPLWRRQRRLAGLIQAPTTLISRVLVVERDGIALFRAAQQLDLEGIVAKRKADPYGPATRWLKIKNPAYTQAEGRWELFQKRR